uniref:Uncharacterized protein n=1 Tax=uncultured bacterium contig00081 TaxID=1181557 RepID=A0A806K145_9BACT|nr:hypothetical protein [uncultured bacterium contig00081]
MVIFTYLANPFIFNIELGLDYGRQMVDTDALDYFKSTAGRATNGKGLDQRRT